MNCPRCRRKYTFDGNRCCHKSCRFGSTSLAETDPRDSRLQQFLSHGGTPALAIWTPEWYALDPPYLQVGLTEEFRFIQCDPLGRENNAALVFHTGMFSEFLDSAWGTISTIHHSDFGAIYSIDASGLDYKISLVDGRDFLVNAEENPGKTLERHDAVWIEPTVIITNWQFTVSFSALAEREPVSLRRDRSSRMNIS